MAKVIASIAEAIVSIINRTYTLFANPIVQIKTAHNADPFTIPAWFVQVVNGKDERAGPPLNPFHRHHHETFDTLGGWAGDASEDDDRVNMRVEFRKKQIGNLEVSIPVMVNSRKVRAGELLRRFATKDEIPEPPASKKRKLS